MLVGSGSGHITLRTSSDVFIFNMGLCSEGLFWMRYTLKAKSRLKGIEDFNLEHWPCSSALQQSCRAPYLAIDHPIALQWARCHPSLRSYGHMKIRSHGCMGLGWHGSWGPCHILNIEWNTIMQLIMLCGVVTTRARRTFGHGRYGHGKICLHGCIYGVGLTEERRPMSYAKSRMKHNYAAEQSYVGWDGHWIAKVSIHMLWCNLVTTRAHVDMGIWTHEDIFAWA